MKFHDDRCKGKAVMSRKPKCGRTNGLTDGQTDRQTDMVITEYPPYFVAGNIKEVSFNSEVCGSNMMSLSQYL